MPIEFRDLNKEADLVKLKIIFNINRICYPGAGDDRRINRPFGSENVFPIDRYPPFEDRSLKYLKGKIEESPYIGDSFDAAYLRCLHPETAELDEILRVLRSEAVIILDMFDCGKLKVDLEVLGNHPGLVLPKLPNPPVGFRVFQKQD